MLRESRRFHVVVITLVVVLICVSCGRGKSSESVLAMSDPTDGLPGRFKSQEPVSKPDFSTASQSAAFQQAIRDATALLGGKPEPLRSEAQNEEVTGGVSFDVSKNKVEAILRKAHADFLSRGFYLFRYQQNFDINGKADKLGLLPTADMYAVMAVMETNGDNYGIGTTGVIAWMTELQQEQPFMLTGIGFDYMEGHFTAPVKDPSELARRMYQFCPDIVDQGVGSVNQLAQELTKGSLYFWWD